VEQKIKFNKKRSRKLKVYPKYVSSSDGTKIVSEIRLSGNWVCECGFKYGKHITITCEENKITITPYDKCKEGLK
jgi:hypothetical protein